ncbi:unnamed protein product [Lepeophtheirus salmonis]|uniref:(salmon louse) hypothetical protein n=1 Tax=Lepeophtheirus salmonis TaxID=72036 RepID=A0A7R8H5W5_LEPSM|nr:unnamed protein product [Lepeophtheirus salmonis]CAF2888274.1 unnamed protein product [Lepeophtheirus salmonis]
MKSLIIGILFILLKSGASVEVENKVIAVEGGIAYLPCDIRPPNSEEQVYLVLWYRYDEGEPLYSYDSRSSSKLTGRRWSDDRGFGARAYFDIDTYPALLKIEDVRREETQSYRCRVDFKSAPTRNSLINLTVIVPPSTPTILNENGEDINFIAGPYEVGSTVILKCVTNGGRPSPEVTWWRDHSLIDSSYEKSFSQTAENLDVKPQTTMFSLPASTSITLDLLFSANKCKNRNPKRNHFLLLKYIKSNVLSLGSRPSATITWWRNNDFLGRTETWEEGNKTYSSFTYTPKPNDNGKRLTCRAENTKLKGSAIEDVWKLTIYYIPEIILNFGANLNPNNIAEGNDVYFECNISSNPPVYKIVWRHNNKIVNHNKSKGIIISGTSLVLQEVKRNATGSYSCTASNTEGDIISNTITLRVMYKPVCSNINIQITGIGKDRLANVSCNVHSHPLPQEFFWTFNNTDKSIDISKYNFSQNSTHSNLLYTPPEDIDYGKLYCWAQNKLGKMESPCIFQIIPAGPPEPPTNCSVVNQTTESLEVRCQSGFDGGSKQHFLLCVTDIETGKTLANSSNIVPEFQISGLNSGRGLLITIYSSNTNGRSNVPVVIEGFTLKVAQLQLESPGAILSPTLGILVGTITTLLIVAFVIMLVIRSKTKRQQRLPVNSSPVSVKEEDNFKTYDESNPDVIPASSGDDMVEISVTQNGTSRIVNRGSPPYLPTSRLDPSTVRRDSASYNSSYNNKGSPTSTNIYRASHPSSWTPLLKSRRAQESVL